MGLNGSTSMASLDEAFKASPPQEKNPFDRNLGVAPRPRSLFHNANASSRSGGSPINISVKRATTTTARPRKQFRRSLSMFESPGDVMKQEKEYIPSGLGSIMDVDEGSGLKLPHFFPADNRPEHGSLPRINHNTMLGVLDGHFQDKYDSVLIVDCRFEYEYEGGHILGAENYNDKEQLSHRLFESCPTSNTLVILHCEYSNHRAPLMYVSHSVIV
jgi:M-phase inducer tyrosine phosphatase